MTCSFPFAALAALALLATLTQSAVGQQPQSYRSVDDVRPRIPDELDRPFWRETQSHRGWEIREDQFTVFADASQADARWAAAHVKAAWGQTAALADHWTRIHRQPDFGLNSTQIVIDSQPPRGRDAQLTTVNVVGIQTQVYLNVASGQPTLEQQVLRLREGAAFALLHTCGFDSAAPPWVVQGMAAVAAEQKLDPQLLKAARDAKLAARFGGQQWRYERSAQDQLDYPALDGNQAALAVKFLLTGDDARHAPALLAAIRGGWDLAERSAALGQNYRGQPGDPQLPPTHTEFDALIGGLQTQLAAWEQDPLVGQPVFDPPNDLPLETLSAEREMLVLLKLQSRFAETGAAGRTRTRVVEFRRQAGPTVVSAASPATAKPPETIDALYARLTDRAAIPWGTLNEHGDLLLSTNRQRIDELFGPSERRYAVLHDGSRLSLTRELESGSQLEGWLEANPDNPARPLAKFAIVEPRVRTKVQTQPVAAASSRSAPKQDASTTRR